MADVEKVARAIPDEAVDAALKEWRGFVKTTTPDWPTHAMRAALEAALAAMTGAEPVAWVIPGEGNARDDGSLDAKCYRDGEFTVPLFATPPRSEATDEIAAIAESLRDAYPMEASRILVLLGRA